MDSKVQSYDIMFQEKNLGCIKDENFLKGGLDSLGLNNSGTAR